jgi:hypothetical protein
MNSLPEAYAPAGRALLVIGDYELPRHDIEVVRFITVSHNTDITQFIDTIVRNFRI